jgi:hypothetical protein
MGNIECCICQTFCRAAATSVAIAHASWVLTSTFPLTVGNWRWLYFARVFLSVGLPVLTALPLLRYVSGRGAPVMLAILMGVTALPIWAAVATLQDLRSGPATLVLGDGTRYLHLTHTRRVLPQPESP